MYSSPPVSLFLLLQSFLRYFQQHASATYPQISSSSKDELRYQDQGGSPGKVGLLYMSYPAKGASSHPFILTYHTQLTHCCASPRNATRSALTTRMGHARPAFVSSSSVWALVPSALTGFGFVVISHSLSSLASSIWALTRYCRRTLASKCSVTASRPIWLPRA